jgi:hypothetical protein
MMSRSSIAVLAVAAIFTTAVVAPSVLSPVSAQATVNLASGGNRVFAGGTP